MSQKTHPVLLRRAQYITNWAAQNIGKRVEVDVTPVVPPWEKEHVHYPVEDQNKSPKKFVILNESDLEEYGNGNELKPGNIQKACAQLSLFD